MYFSAAPSSENDQGSMNLASKTAPVPSTIPSSVAAIQANCRVPDQALDVPDRSAGIALVPGPVEVFGGSPELHDEVAGKVLWLSLAPFLPPEADEARPRRRP